MPTALADPVPPASRAPVTMSATRAGGRVLARPSTLLAPRILILGGGFAGVTAALELAKRCAGLLPVHITLVSNQNFFLFTPMLVEAATGAVETRHILYPIRPLCGRWGIEFGEMQVEGIDLERRRVTVRHHRSPLRQQVQYDKLVLALGATPNVGQAAGAAEHALTFKDVGDAFRIRNRVIELFEAAALTEDPWIRRRLLTFVVVGAGHAGTELMAAVEELTRGILVRHYPSVPPETVRLVLVGSQVLPQTATNLAAYTKEKLIKRGIADLVALVGCVSLSLHQLLFRIAIAGVFLRAGLTKISSWESTVALFTDEYKVPVLAPHLAAAMAATFEVGCSTLLLIGLGTRLAALPLIGMIMTIQLFVYPQAWSEHLVWGSILCSCCSPAGAGPSRSTTSSRGDSLASSGAANPRGPSRRQTSRT
jgi:uncharacterized membrane protein YphA (DoxX/SURF4 family)